MLTELEVPGSFVFTPRRFSDDRGWFSETYNQGRLSEVLGDLAFVQDNHSLSRRPYTLRGMHFQIAPKAQAKLVRVVRGAVLDVIVDIRRSSPAYGQVASAKLTAEGGEQLFAPVGTAHGFLTLEPDTEVIYKVSDYHAPECERGLLWRDPALAIPWPVAPADVVIVPRDDAFPVLAEMAEHFD